MKLFHFFHGYVAIFFALMTFFAGIIGNTLAAPNAEASANPDAAANPLACKRGQRIRLGTRQGGHPGAAVLKDIAMEQLATGIAGKIKGE